MRKNTNRVGCKFHYVHPSRAGFQNVFFPQGSFHQNRPDLLQMALSLCAPTHMAVKLYSPAEY